jgi:hypothetical protein
MRQLLPLLLSLGTLGFTSLSGQTAEKPLSAAEVRANRAVELAEQELQKITDLVAAGALPRIRVEQAELDLADARDEAILERTLFGDFTANAGSDEETKEIIDAAQRRVDRQRTRLERARELIAAGVTAESYLLPIQEELTFRQTSLDLARLHARLMTEMAASNVPKIPDTPETAIDETSLFWQGMEHYEGGGVFDESRDLAPIEVAFESKFARPLPISAEGATELHRALGFDHRGRVDVAVVPSQPEGIWLRQYLRLHNIPYYAFAHAIPGKATAAHIHIGPGSLHFSSRLSTRQAARPHIAD